MIRGCTYTRITSYLVRVLRYHLVVSCVCLMRRERRPGGERCGATSTPAPLLCSLTSAELACGSRPRHQRPSWWLCPMLLPKNRFERNDRTSSTSVRSRSDYCTYTGVQVHTRTKPGIRAGLVTVRVHIRRIWRNKFQRRTLFRTSSARSTWHTSTCISPL